MTRLRSDRALLAAVAVGLVSVAVRLPGVWSGPFWQDEVASARILVQPTLLDAVRRVARTESTPPLWYVLGWVGHRAGVSVQDERLLSVLFGGLLAAFVVVLAARLTMLPLAITAGLMTALGQEFVWHGHELRAYELLALASVCFALTLLAEVRAPSRRNELALAGTVAIGGLTHFFFAFTVLAALGWLWLDPGTRIARRRATLAILAGGVVAATWAPVLVSQYGRGHLWWIGRFRLRAVVAAPLQLFTSTYDRPPMRLLLSVAFLVVVLAGSIRLVRRSPEGRLIVALAVVPLVASALAWDAGFRIFDVRNLIEIGAFVAVTVVAAAEMLPRAIVPLACIGVSVALGFSLAGSTGIPRYDRMAQALVRDGWNGAEPIAVFGDALNYRSPLEWYLPRRPVLDVAPAESRVCSPVFVIEPGGTISRVAAADRSSLVGTTLLVDPAGARRCARSVAARRSVPRRRRTPVRETRRLVYSLG